MVLPEVIRSCLDRLETAGYAAYTVGGCVRDSLLGLAPHDYDLCTAAAPAQIRQIFSGFPLVLSGEKHGTVGVVTKQGVVEITTFRTEGDYHDRRHPDWVAFIDNVEADLSRRDFTINAIAYSPTRGLIDPFGGQADLKSHTLRAVGDPVTQFQEDPLRILRGVRFAVRYGLAPEPATEAAMLSLRESMDSLARERVFSELCKLLPLVKAEDLLYFAPIFTQVLPELAPAVGFDQHSSYHAYDLYTHIAHVVAAVPQSLTLRFAALLHDIGKPAVFYLDENGHGHFPDHAKTGAEMADGALRRLKAPNALRERVVWLTEAHMNPLAPDKKLLRRRLSRYGEEAVRELLALQMADFGSKGTGKSGEPAFSEISTLLSEILAENACLKISDLVISGRDLIALGFAPGPMLGKCLESLLTGVQDETLENTRETLIAAAIRFKQTAP